MVELAAADRVREEAEVLPGTLTVAEDVVTVQAADSTNRNKDGRWNS